MSNIKLEISQHFRAQDFMSKNQLTEIERKVFVAYRTETRLRIRISEFTNQ